MNFIFKVEIFSIASLYFPKITSSVRSVHQSGTFGLAYSHLLKLYFMELHSELQKCDYVSQCQSKVPLVKDTPLPFLHHWPELRILSWSHFIFLHSTATAQQFPLKFPQKNFLVVVMSSASSSSIHLEWRQRQVLVLVLEWVGLRSDMELQFLLA